MVFKTARGTRDFLPVDMIKRDYVEKIVKEIFESFGFQRIQTPTFEEFELFAKRSGEEIRDGMFTFFCDNQEYALRPELTAAVCRLITTGKLNIPKPYEVYYIGQCFRYERPQSGRYREFTQAGLELMGTKSPMADAKVIAVAATVLERLGITNYNLKIGNIGIYRELLKEKGFEFDKQCEIIGAINRVLDAREKLGIVSAKEKFEESDKEFILNKLNEIYEKQNKIGYSGEHEVLPVAEKNINDKFLRDSAKKLPKIFEETNKLMLIQRFEIKKDFADLLFKISEIKGKRKDVEETAKNILKDTSALKILKELIEVLDWLENYGINKYEMVLGVARGLDFYTDTVFEFDLPFLGAQKQVCGGGRYDKLVEEFGGPSTPATGFAFGFDRLTEALEKTGKDKGLNYSKADIMVIAIDRKFLPKTLEIMQELRENGIKCQEDLNFLGLNQQIDYARKVNINYIIVIGDNEIKAKKVKVKNLKTNEEKGVQIGKIADFFKK